MTELQASLMAIGGVIVVGVISYNKWQEWRAKKSVEQAFSPLDDDVLMGGGPGTDATGPAGPGSVPGQRQEPVLSPFEGPDAVVAHEHDALVSSDRTEPGAGDAPPARTSFIEPASRPALLDDVIDCIIPLALDAPLRGEKVSTAFQRWHIVGNKPVRVIGESEGGQWEPVAVGGIYRALQVGVQMSTRSGPLTELEFSELASQLDQMSDDLGSTAALPDMADVMAAARALYQQVQEFDAQLSINVRALGAPWALATLRPALQRQGMELRPDGRLVMPDGEGGILFSVLTNAEPDDTTRLITLLLPVARVAPALDGFKAMSAFAKSLSTRLSGTVVDDEGQPLSDAALAAIAAQVRDFYQQMEQSGIPAGSARAQRLFA